jgi:hypothetical protein
LCRWCDQARLLTLVHVDLAAFSWESAIPAEGAFVDPDQADSVLARVEGAEAELAATRVADSLDWLEVEQDRIGDAMDWLLEP